MADDACHDDGQGCWPSGLCHLGLAREVLVGLAEVAKDVGRVAPWGRPNNGPATERRGPPLRGRRGRRRARGFAWVRRNAAVVGRACRNQNIARTTLPLARPVSR